MLVTFQLDDAAFDKLSRTGSDADTDIDVRAEAVISLLALHVYS